MFYKNYNRLLIKIVTFTGLAIFGELALAGETIKNGASKNPLKSVPVSTKSYAQAPLDKDTDTLPVGYLGHSCEAIAKALKLANPVKGEYETSSEFVNRIESFKSTKMYGSVGVGDLVGFSPINPDDLKTKYNADHEEMNVDFNLGVPQILSTDPSSAVIIESKKVSDRTYLAENVFGKKTKVTVEGFSVCAFTEVRGGTYFLGGYKKDFDFHFAREDALASKNSMRILFVGRLAPPYIGEYHDYLKPTPSMPYESYTKGPLIALRLFQIWVYNKDTGKVLAKVGTIPADQ